MSHRKLFARIRDLLTSLVLVLAVSLAWPAMGAPHDPPPLSGHHAAAAEATGNAHDHGDHDASPACSSDLGCCVMTHCHPGVAQPPLPMPHAALFPVHLPSAVTDEAGIVPAILVPPPRLLLG